MEHFLADLGKHFGSGLRVDVTLDVLVSVRSGACFESLDRSFSDADTVLFPTSKILV